MVTAIDIITYIGIPLAVLGVLPTIYTCLKSYLTLRQITKSLARNGVDAITRSSLLSGVVEVEIKRVRVRPLGREVTGYWETRRCLTEVENGEGRRTRTRTRRARKTGPSTMEVQGRSWQKCKSGLRGGSYTFFNWNQMLIGTKSYRLQYHDELRQPQSEKVDGIDEDVEMELVVGSGPEPVLSVSVSDDSDGVLSLALNWREEWDVRSVDNLPPYWIRVGLSGVEKVDVLRAVRETEGGNDNRTSPESEGDTNINAYSDAALEDGSPPSPIRLRLSPTGLQEAHYESPPHHPLSLPHIQSPPPSPPSSISSTNFWFSCAATALESTRNLSTLVSFTIPTDIINFTRRDTMPRGILVLLGLLSDAEVPKGRTPLGQNAEIFEKHLKLTEQARRIQEENRMPPGPARDEARRKRTENDAREFHNEMMRKLAEQQRRKEEEVGEALRSPRVGVGVVGKATLAFLEKDFYCNQPKIASLTTEAVVEQILYGMLVGERFAQRLASMLDLWKTWAGAGGMTKSDYEVVKEDKVAFVLASLVLCVIRSTISEPMGAVGGDLQECMRVWKMVRLG
ncbi:hypothetical protein GQ43DRAFT_279916 [Delitschia confertaspora ATCC 74209]|uniref:Uncharacterized protein n=1 Tax=Delitschia confertaspora ATCC 74209 TaxID=1513339 RepID=A0A9P4JAP1_9PLEO|nr:hypothetical protein GQ43DRAFT_279916 [Delitschia confertaspora ATCC 74209]